MAYHKRTHSIDYIFACDLCDFTTKMKGHVKNHIERKHSCKKAKSGFKCREDSVNIALPELSFVEVKEELPEPQPTEDSIPGDDSEEEEDVKPFVGIKELQQGHSFLQKVKFNSFKKTICS